NLFQGAPMLALYDEHDGFTGLLTAEDVVEQIVGEIYDETDERAAPELVQLEGGALRMSGALLLDVAAEALGAPELGQDEDVDTIGGLVVTRLARLPKAGDEVELGGYTATVESAKGFRVLSLVCRPRAPLSTDDPDEAPT